MPKCKGRKADGAQCRSPEHLVLPSGFCRAHDPEYRERGHMGRIGVKGAAATARRWRDGGMETDQLPALDSAANATTWLEAIGRAVLEKRISYREGQAAARVIEIWLKAADAQVREEDLADLQAKIAELQRKGLVPSDRHRSNASPVKAIGPGAAS